MPKDGSSVDASGGGQGQRGLGSEASANDDKAKPDVEKGPEEVLAEQSKVPREKAETKTEVETS
jgi:hypothetical protein